MNPDDQVQKMLEQYFARQHSEEVLRDCPNEEILHDFLQGVLAKDVERDVERHLLQCDRCVETLVAVAELLHEMHSAGSVPAGLTDRLLSSLRQRPASRLRAALKIFKARCAAVAEGLADFLSGDEPECAYVRGSRKVISGSLVVLEKVFKEIRLEIEIEKTGDRETDIHVVVTHPATGAPLNAVRLNLICEAGELVSQGVVRGQALFDHIAFGRYRLCAWRREKKLGEVLLTIEE